MAKYISNLKKISDKIEVSIKKVTEEVAREGYEVALDVAYNAVKDVLVDGGDYTPDIDVDLVETDSGYEIVLSGEDAMFVEFGAGVHFNSGGYPLQRPQGVAGIGQLGYGQGKKDSWTFMDGEERVRTYGTPASMPLYKARKAMIERLKK